MLVSYFNKEKIIEDRKNKENSNNYIICDADVKHNSKVFLEHGIKSYCMDEKIYAFAHDVRQPISVLSLIASDLEQSFEYGEIDAQYIHNTAQMLRNQTKRLDGMLDVMLESLHGLCTQVQKQAVYEIIEDIEHHFDDNVHLFIDCLACVWGQPYLLTCLFYSLFCGIQSYCASTKQDSITLHITPQQLHFCCKDKQAFITHAQQFHYLLKACNRCVSRQKIPFRFDYTQQGDEQLIRFVEGFNT